MSDKQRSVSHATFVLERRYKASAARVYRALSEPGAKAQWFTPPETWGKDEQTMDFRIGGVETSIGGPVGGPVHAFHAVYQDIVPNERIVYSYFMMLDDVRISVSVSTFELVADGDFTKLKLTEMGAYLDGFDDGGRLREEGTNVLLDKLGRFVEGDWV
ncbi:MAG TPA: SRPBCC family protein [Devosia sp.]|nr:SRPBCC family protein [Devosia sp.]